MGGQVVNGGKTNYPGYSYVVDGARLYIATKKPAPVYMVEHHSSQDPWSPWLYPDLTWQFDPNFFSVDGGYALRSFDFVAPGCFHVGQTFQITPSQDWLFKQGSCWDSFSSETPENLECSMELTNLTMDTPLQFLRTSKIDGYAVFDWTTFGKPGIAVTLESAPDLKGPWFPIVNTEATNIMAGIAATIPSQFYRLKAPAP
jgi:hypothetical protein